MGINQVNNVNQNATKKLTPEEIAKRQEEFKKIQEEGHEIVLSARGKNSGVSYDYMDRLNYDIEAGIFEDKNNDGFSNKDKKSLGKEFESVFTEHGYNTKFTKMQKGDSFSITYDDYIRLANSAGYVLKEKTEPEKKAVETTPTPQTTETEETTPVTEEKVITTEETKNENDDKNIVLEFETTTITDSEGDAISEVTEYTLTDIDGNPISSSTVTNPFAQASKKKIVSEPDALPTTAKKDKTLPEVPTITTQTTEAEAPKTEEVTTETTGTEAPITAEENIQEEIENEFSGVTDEGLLNAINEQRISLNNEKRELEKTTETYQTKGIIGLFKKTKTRELSAEEIASRQARIAEINEELDQNDKYKTYVKDVQNNKYWGGKYAAQELRDENGNIINSYPTYNRVTVTNSNGEEVKVAKVGTYNTQTYDYDYKYYSLDVQKVGNPQWGSGTYYSVVPDMNNELTDINE